MALANPCLASSFSYTGGKEKELRRSAEYHPTVWGNQFITISKDQEKLDAWSKRVGHLKEEVKEMLENAKGSEKLEMELIDNLQRLGVAYHFEKEIEEALRLMYHISCISPTTDSDLHSTALRFRLFRQQGYRVPSDVFSKFMEQQGRFKETLITKDQNGMLSLYEAAFLDTHGDAILDEALAFTKKELRLAVDAGRLEPPLEAMVKHALELPLRRRIHRLEARHYISLYEQQQGHSAKLLELAKLDYNLVQTLHQKELEDISGWWKELDLAGKLTFARDRVVECYLWPVGVFHEPKHARARDYITKLIAVTSVIDDIYDVHGTFNELQLFTDAIQGWDLTAMDQLPDYMKACYNALLSCIKAMEEDLAPEGNSYRVNYLIEAMKRLCREYLVEASWFNQGHTPGVDEYLRCSLISCAYPMIIILCYVGMEDEIPEELFAWLRSDPKIVDGTSRVCRLMDDIVSNRFEQERGHVASAVQCYMKEHGSSEQEACEKLREMVDVAWKDINGGCLEAAAPFPVPLLERILNLARVMEVLYQYGDGYTFSNTDTKESIASLFLNAIPV